MFTLYVLAMQIYIIDTQKSNKYYTYLQKMDNIYYFFANFSKVSHPLAFSHYRERAL